MKIIFALIALSVSITALADTYVKGYSKKMGLMSNLTIEAHRIAINSTPIVRKAVAIRMQCLLSSLIHLLRPTTTAMHTTINKRNGE